MPRTDPFDFLASRPSSRRSDILAGLAAFGVPAAFGAYLAPKDSRGKVLQEGAIGTALGAVPGALLFPGNTRATAAAAMAAGMKRVIDTASSERSKHRHLRTQASIDALAQKILPAKVREELEQIHPTKTSGIRLFCLAKEAVLRKLAQDNPYSQSMALGVAAPLPNALKLIAPGMVSSVGRGMQQAGQWLAQHQPAAVKPVAQAAAQGLAPVGRAVERTLGPLGGALGAAAGPMSTPAAPGAMQKYLPVASPRSAPMMSQPPQARPASSPVPLLPRLARPASPSVKSSV